VRAFSQQPYAKCVTYPGAIAVKTRNSEIIPGQNSASFYMPLENEGARGCSREVKAGSEAYSLVDTVDRERAAFIQQYLHLQWPKRSLYHAMINTDFAMKG
jgi:hypothetical protein